MDAHPIERPLLVACAATSSLRRPAPARALIEAWRAVVLAALALALLAGLAPAPVNAKSVTSPGEGRMLAVRIDGPITPVSAEALENALDRAEREGYRALLLELDTPGGLESSMRVMVKRLLAAQVPVIAWVAPSGARAASAGVFIVMAADVAAMARGTNIGAATPVSMQGPMDSTLSRKAANDAAAFARTVAAQRGRNVEWAEDAVRRAVAASETEAVTLDVVDFVAATLPQVQDQAHGRSYRRGAATRRLEVRGLPVDRVEPGFRQRLLAVLADPNVAYILLMLGFYGLLFELQNPGAILPGVVGGICIVLAFFSLSTLSVNYAGLALIVLAVVFFIAEIKVASHGLLAAGGVIAMLLGSLFLFQGDNVRVSLAVVLGATLATALFFLFIVGAGLRAQRRPARTGREGLVGARAVVIETLQPQGWVRIGDERWQARSDGVAETGVEVVVTGVEGLTLRVRPAAKEANG
jgi:membrane-bound serine protease (ClpP class)